MLQLMPCYLTAIYLSLEIVVLYPLQTNINFSQDQLSKKTRYPDGTGFPKKDARFSKLKSIPDLLSDEMDGKILENIDF